MANKQHAQFSDENGNIFYLENETEDVLDPSGKPLSNGGDLSEASVTFTPDATRKLPQSGGRFKAFLGSIVKYLTDLGAAAYLAVANNCTTTQAGSLLDARQGKVLMDKANQLNSELTANETKFYFDFQNEQWGFNTDPARGADTFHPFRSAPIDCGTYAATMNYAGSSLNVDIKQYCTDYKKLTKDNFFIIVNTINFSSTTAANVGGTITYSYDADAGIFTVYGKVPNNFWSAAINFNLYALL